MVWGKEAALLHQQRRFEMSTCQKAVLSAVPKWGWGGGGGGGREAG